MLENISENPPIVKLGIGNIEMGRLDPQYYSPHFTKPIMAIKKRKYNELDELFEFIRNGSECRNYIDDGEPFFRISDLNEFFIDYLNVLMIPKVESEVISAKKKINSKTILVARSGEPGITTFPPKFSFKSDVSSHSILCDLKSEKNKIFLTFYLNSKYGKLFFDRATNGGTIKEISQPQLLSIIVPALTDKFKESLNLFGIISSLLYYLAEALVQWMPEFTMDHLGIEMPEQSDDMCFTVRPDEINEDVEFRLSPRMEIGKRTTIQIANKISKPKKMTEEVNVLRKMLNPMKTPVKVYNLLLFKNCDAKIMEPPAIKQAGRDFTQNQVIVPDDTIIVGEQGTDKRKIFSSPNLPDTLVYYLSIVFRPKGNYSFIKAMWRTQFIQNQMAYLLAGKSNENMSPMYFSQLILPEIRIDEQNKIGEFFDESMNSMKKLFSLTKTLLNIGTTLLEDLIEAESDKQRSAVTDILTEITETINADIFVDDFTRLPDYYDNYCNHEEYDRLITNLPGDYQYDTFEDYKRAGKYIDAEKLAALKGTVDGYAKQAMPPEDTKETKIERLVDLIVKVLANKSADLSSILKVLHRDYAVAIKPYEIGLEDTVKDALHRHSQQFKYDQRFRAWELIDYKRIEEANLQREGKKQFLEYTKGKVEDSEARAPDQRHLVHALIAFLDEGDVAHAREVDALINERKLVKEERTLYMTRRWQMKR